MIHHFNFNPIFFKMLIYCFRDVEFYKEDDTIKNKCDSIISLSELLTSNSISDYYDIAYKLFHFSHVIFLSSKIWILHYPILNLMIFFSLIIIILLFILIPIL